MGWLKKNLQLTEKETILYDSKDAIYDEDGNVLIDVAYRRVSTEKQSMEGYGLEMQLDKIKACCKEIGSTSCILMTDDGFTGTKMERPGLDCFISRLNDFNSGRTNIRIRRFIIPRMDRLARTLLGTLQFIQDYIVQQEGAKSEINQNKYLVEFVSCDERFIKIVANQFGEIDATSKLILSIFAMFAEFDRDQIVNKLKTGREMRAQAGYPLGGGNTPYGYRYDTTADGGIGNYITIPEEKEKILEARRLFVEEHMPPYQIMLNLGFTNEGVVRNILKSRSYLNKIPFKGNEYPGHFEAFFTEEQWEEQQDEFAKRSKKGATGRYLLTGLLYCGNCGAKMRYQKWGDTVRIRCYSQDSSFCKKSVVHDPNCPNKTNYYSEDIEKEVIKALFAISKEFNKNNIKTKPVYDAVYEMEKELKKKQKRFNTFLRDFGNTENTTTNELIRSYITGLSEEIDALAKKISEEKEKNKESFQYENMKIDITNLEESWEFQTMAQKKEVCKQFIHKVVLTSTPDGPKMEVQFRFDKTHKKSAKTTT